MHIYVYSIFIIMHNAHEPQKSKKSIIMPWQAFGQQDWTGDDSWISPVIFGDSQFVGRLRPQRLHFPLSDGCRAVKPSFTRAKIPISKTWRSFQSLCGHCLCVTLLTTGEHVPWGPLQTWGFWGVPSVLSVLPSCLWKVIWESKAQTGSSVIW